MTFRTLLSTGLCLTALGAGTAHAVPAIGLAGATLFSFDTATPSVSSAAVTLSGLRAGENILSIDVRPATSVLYGLGSAGNLYTISTTSGVATFASTVTPGLSGTDFDISFNPTVDRLRIVSNVGQDLRVNVDTGAATVDTPLAYAAGDANSGRTPAVSAIGYTNQVAGATTTVLYDLDPANTAFAIQNPPNNGTLNTTGTLTTAGLISFDIAGTGAAFAATSTALYSLNLANGATTLIGNFGRTGVTDFALAAVPEPISLSLLAVGLAATATLRRRTTA